MNKKYYPYIAGGILLFLLARKTSSPVSVGSDTASNFVLSMIPAAQNLQYETGINPIIAITQAAHESGWGTSTLARKGLNLFGIKATSSWKSGGGAIIALPTKEYTLFGLIPYTTYAEFKKYPSYDDSFFDWYKLLSSYDRYINSLQAAVSGTLKDFAYAISRSGYATDPNYGSKILAVGKIVEQYA